MTEKLLTVEQVAERLAVKLPTLRAWIWKKKIECVRIGGCVRIREKVIQDLVTRGTCDAEGGAVIRCNDCDGMVNVQGRCNCPIPKHGTYNDATQRRADREVLERLREAESMLGSPTVETDPFMRDGRLRWLRSTRKLLRLNGVKPENLPGEWHT